MISLSKPLKSIFCILGLLGMVLILGGCGQTRVQADRDRSGTMLLPSGPAAEPKVRKVGIVSAYGGPKESELNSAVARAVYQAGQTLRIQVMLIQHGDFANNREAMNFLVNNGCDLVIGLGQSQEEDLAEVAKANPEALFAGVDITAEAPNIASRLFREDEGAYLAGVLAGQVTKTNLVGFVGGANWPEINRMEKAYRAGVDYYAKLRGGTVPIQVYSSYIGLLDKAFNQPDKGKALAGTILDSGADVVFHAAGQSGEGVIQAAAERNVFAIGSGYDQTQRYPGTVVASPVKNYQGAIYQLLADLTTGKLKPGTTTVGVKEKGVSLMWSQVITNPQWQMTVSQAAYQL
ncbi:MAG TPA: BMP family ABC transporter substrate-binding protein [Bacillota bacterium]|nr:BMP family ABC transporter substrate-binding protein [Bacillota bacterium]